MMPRRHQPESGASLVELAILAPFLILLLFGIIEFASLYAQNLDVRHGAREAARLAAGNYPEGPTTSAPRTSANTDILVDAICARMDDSEGATVTVSSSGSQGDAISVELRKPGEPLTGVLGWSVLENLILSATAEGRLLYAATWADTTDQACTP